MYYFFPGGSGPFISRAYKKMGLSHELVQVDGSGSLEHLSSGRQVSRSIATVCHRIRKRVGLM